MEAFDFLTGAPVKNELTYVDSEFRLTHPKGHLASQPRDRINIVFCSKVYVAP
jgi:hypothetical protein